MELSEKERLMLVDKIDEVRKLTQKIIKNIHSDPDEVLLKENIISILNIINIIASYTESKNYELQYFSDTADSIFSFMRMVSNDEIDWYVVNMLLDRWCVYVNSIRYKITKRGIKINIPKIDLTIFKIPNLKIEHKARAVNSSPFS